jgi:flagella basal body P-ring formation protein FlgA
MFLNATALERGAIGQRVRVKIQPTGRVLDARVVGHGQLEAEF